MRKIAATALALALAFAPIGYAMAATNGVWSVSDSNVVIGASPVGPVADSPVAVPAAPAPAAQQNTITTSGPVTSDTTISLGTLAGEVLKWVISAFGTVIGTVATYAIVQFARKMGVQVTQQMSDQLNQTLVNGLNDAAQKISAGVAGKAPLQIKNEIINGAVQYAQEHRAETIKALGLDPQSGAAVAALRARIATLAADPNMPTPAIVSVGDDTLRKTPTTVVDPVAVTPPKA